jgi:ubiquitin-conjugating enzyme E2 G1
MALRRLQAEYKQYINDSNCFYSIEPDSTNFFLWNILLLGSPNTIFEGGVFKCQLIFPQQYPNKPPIFKFISNLPHPNIYNDGKVCISILHEGQDEFGYEDISERWNPSHSVNSILMSILSIIIAPNFDSPADVDMSKLWREDFNKYKNIIYKIIAHQ